MLSKSPASKTLDKTPKQKKLVPKIQSEQKDDLKKNNKKRKSLPAELINGSDDTSPKKSKREPFAGTSDVFMQNKSMDINKEVKELDTQLKKRKRTIDLKTKRLAAKDKFRKTIMSAAAGDDEAITHIKTKIANLEAQENLTNSGKRRLRMLRRALKDKDTKVKPLHSTKNEVGKQPNTTKKEKSKKAVNDNVKDEELKKKDNNKNKRMLLTKAPVESEEESDNDEGEEEEEESENETSNLIDNESLEEEDGGEGEEEEDETEEEDESEEEDEDKSEEDNEEEEDNSDAAAEEENESDDENVEKPSIEPPKKKAKTKSLSEENPEKINSSTGNKSQLTLFVGNIPFDATQEDIAEHFSKAGNIKDIRIPVDKKTNKSRGFAYVELQNETSYQKALSLHHSSLKGRKINVMDSESNKKSSSPYSMKQGGRPFGNNRGRGPQRGRQNTFRGNKRY